MGAALKLLSSFISSDNSLPLPLGFSSNLAILLLGVSEMEDLHARSSTFLAEFLRTSAGLWSDLMYLHASGPIVSYISATFTETNGLNFLYWINPEQFLAIADLGEF